MSGLTNKLFGTPATEVPKVAAAATDVSGRMDGTSALDQRRNIRGVSDENRCNET